MHKFKYFYRNTITCLHTNVLHAGLLDYNGQKVFSEGVPVSKCTNFMSLLLGTCVLAVILGSASKYHCWGQLFSFVHVTENWRPEV